MLQTTFLFYLFSLFNMLGQSSIWVYIIDRDMGNQTSDFQQQFHKLYNFIAIIDDPLFKKVKIYRKLKHNFDHIMIIEKPIVQLSLPNSHSSPKSFIVDKLGLIRRFQNRFTTHLQYFHLLEQKTLECSAPMIRMYVDYYSHSLYDYLGALRMKRNSLACDEIILVVRCLAEAMLAIRRMGLENYRITLNNIYLIASEGIILLSPVHILYQSMLQAYNTQTINIFSNQFQAYSDVQRGAKERNMMELENREKKQIENIVIELSRYLGRQELEGPPRIISTIRRCRTLVEVTRTFVTEIDELNVQQFGESPQQSVHLYEPQ